MTRLRRSFVATGLFAAVVAASGGAFAQTPACPGGLRKITVAVSVSPPNVVHTTPYVAKELGFFARHCVDANIVQFDGGAAGTMTTAVAQGTVVGNLTAAAVAQGIRARQIWGFLPAPPQSYEVAASIKTFADLKGKRLSAAGGIGGFNWLMGREVLKRAGLTVEDAQFIAQGTAGRLPGLLTGQLDGVVLHPEDIYIAQQKKPDLHVLISLSDLLPKLQFNSYGVANDWLAKDRPLIRDTVAAMIEANREIYRNRDEVVPIMMQATDKPRDAVEYAWDQLTKNCIWAVNEGLDRERALWSIDNDVANGDIEAAKKPTFEQVADETFAREAVAAAGGPVTIGACKE
jgi:ABC-type nitrate/sulfonate/bicarbonate transport system substrate-binding protein